MANNIDSRKTSREVVDEICALWNKNHSSKNCLCLAKKYLKAGNLIQKHFTYMCYQGWLGSQLKKQIDTYNKLMNKHEGHYID